MAAHAIAKQRSAAAPGPIAAMMLTTLTLAGCTASGDVLVTFQTSYDANESLSGWSDAESASHGWRPGDPALGGKLGIGLFDAMEHPPTTIDAVADSHSHASGTGWSQEMGGRRGPAPTRVARTPATEGSTDASGDPVEAKVAGKNVTGLGSLPVDDRGRVTILVHRVHDIFVEASVNGLAAKREAGCTQAFSSGSQGAAIPYGRRSATLVVRFQVECLEDSVA